MKDLYVWDSAGNANRLTRDAKGAIVWRFVDELPEAFLGAHYDEVTVFNGEIYDTKGITEEGCNKLGISVDAMDYTRWWQGSFVPASKEQVLAVMLPDALKPKRAMPEQLTIGGLLNVLTPLPGSHRLKFGIGYLAPTGKVNSYRGDYSQLAIAFADEAQCTVAQLRDALNHALTVPFEGYKGGTYDMYMHTPVWVANWGNSGSTGIHGFSVTDDEVLLLTADYDSDFGWCMMSGDHFE